VTFLKTVNVTDDFFFGYILISADPCGSAVLDMGPQQLVCWDCGFDFRQWHGCLSPLSVVCYQVEVCTSGRSLVQSSPTECGVPECDLETSSARSP